MPEVYDSCTPRYLSPCQQQKHRVQSSEEDLHVSLSAGLVPHTPQDAEHPREPTFEIYDDNDENAPPSAATIYYIHRPPLERETEGITLLRCCCQTTTTIREKIQAEAGRENTKSGFRYRGSRTANGRYSTSKQSEAGL
jgi:hypothetical protein